MIKTCKGYISMCSRSGKLTLSHKIPPMCRVRKRTWVCHIRAPIIGIYTRSWLLGNSNWILACWSKILIEKIVMSHMTNVILQKNSVESLRILIVCRNKAKRKGYWKNYFRVACFTQILLWLCHQCQNGCRRCINMCRMTESSKLKPMKSSFFS